MMMMMNEESTASELREAIIENSDLFMIDYSDDQPCNSSARIHPLRSSAKLDTPRWSCWPMVLMATDLLLADPGHRAVKRGTLTSLVKFSDESYSVLRNENIT